MRQTPTRLELLWGLSGLAVEAGRPAEAQPSAFFPLSQAGSTADEASAGRAWRLEICIHLLIINRKDAPEPCCSPSPAKGSRSLEG